MTFRAAIRQRGATDSYLTGVGEDGWAFGSRARARLFPTMEEAERIAKAIPGEVETVPVSDALQGGSPMG